MFAFNALRQSFAPASYDQSELGNEAYVTPGVSQLVELGPTSMQPVVSVADGQIGVLVLTLDYTKFGQDAARKYLEEAARFLKDQGFGDIDARRIESAKKDGSGRFALWVARGESKDALEPTVKKLRGLLFKGKSAFRSAVALERPKD